MHYWLIGDTSQWKQHLSPSKCNNKQASCSSFLRNVRIETSLSSEEKGNRKDNLQQNTTKYSFPSFRWHLEGDQWKTTLPFYKTVAGEEFPAYLIKLVNLTFLIPKTRYWWSPALHRPQRIKLLHWKLCETISLLCIFKRSRCQS